MGTKVENAASDEETIMVSLFLVMSTTQVDKLNGWSSKRFFFFFFVKKKKNLTAVKYIIKTLWIRDF